MKTQLFCLILILTAHSILSQSNDLQWLISNSKGKNGLDASGNFNKFESVAPYLIDKSIVLQNIALPSLSVPHARNDIFVIYDNYNYYNSRDINVAGLSSHDFFINPDPAHHQTDHSFITTGTAKILYLYLTNRYEGDDPPLSVRAQSNSNPSSYDLSGTPSSIISVNHDIVFNKDITVIVNNNFLGNAENDVVTMKYDGVEDLNTHITNSVPDFLALNNVFESASGYSPVLPIGSYSNIGPAQIRFLNSNVLYRFVNFRPNLSYYDQYHPKSDGSPNYNAVFSILRNGTEIQKLSVGISYSYDPNFLRVDSLCKTSDEDFMIFYHLEFQNTSRTTAVNKLKAMVSFHDGFDLSCFQATKWFAGGELCNGTVKEENRTVTFNFTDNKSLARFGAKYTGASTGYVEFRVRVKSGIDLIDINNSINLKETGVAFDSVTFEIKDFYDRISYDGDKNRRLITTHTCCYCSDFNWTIVFIAILILLTTGVVIYFRIKRR